MNRTRWTVAALLVLAVGAAVAVLATRGGDGVRSVEEPRGALPQENAPPGLAARPGVAMADEPPAGPVPAPIREAGWRLEGRVVDPAGAGVAGATVVAMLWRGESSSLLPAANTGADGAYSIDLEAVRRLRPIARQGVYLVVEAFAGGYAPSESLTAQEWPSDAAAPAAIRRDLTLRAGDLLFGRVVHENGKPVPSADVSCCDGEGRVGAAATSFADGRFAIERPAGTGWKVVALSPDVGAGSARIDPSPEVREVGDVVLHPTPRVEGRVVFADGAPVREARVLAQLESAAAGVSIDRCLSRWWQGRARTGNDGAFAVLLPGEGRCKVWLEGAAAETHATTGDRDARIVVAGHRVRVRVVDETGEALAGLGYSTMWWSAEHVGRLDDLLAGRVGLESARRNADEFAAGTSSDATTDLFSPAGSASTFVVHPRGADPGEAVIRVPATGNESEVVVRLAPRTGGGRLRLRVVDEADAPVTAAYVSADTSLGSDLWSGVLPDDAVIGPLRAGRVILAVRPTRGGKDEGHVPPLDSWLLPTTAAVDVDDGATTDATVRMRFGGRIRLLVRSPQGGPAATGNYMVRAVPVTGGDMEAPMTYEEPPPGETPQRMSSRFSADRPYVTAGPLAPGDWLVTVHVSGAGTASPVASREVRVRARDVVDYVVDLPPGK